MATKSAKVGEKRKASGSDVKVTKKFSGKNERPDSTRKLWKNDDAPDDSSDDDNGFSGEEEDGAAPPAKKKVKQVKEDSNQSSSKPAKTFEKGVLRTLRRDDSVS